MAMFIQLAALRHTYYCLVLGVSISSTNEWQWKTKVYMIIAGGRLKKIPPNECCVHCRECMKTPLNEHYFRRFKASSVYRRVAASTVQTMIIEMMRTEGSLTMGCHACCIHVVSSCPLFTVGQWSVGRLVSGQMR